MEAKKKEKAAALRSRTPMSTGVIGVADVAASRMKARALRGAEKGEYLTIEQKKIRREIAKTRVTKDELVLSDAVHELSDVDVDADADESTESDAEIAIELEIDDESEADEDAVAVGYSRCHKYANANADANAEM